VTTPMSYDGSVSGTTSYITQMATMAVVAETDPAFLTILPQMIVYAELRMYRDLDFLFTSGSTTAYSLTAGNRILNIYENRMAKARKRLWRDVLLSRWSWVRVPANPPFQYKPRGNKITPDLRLFSCAIETRKGASRPPSWLRGISSTEG